MKPYGYKKFLIKDIFNIDTVKDLIYYTLIAGKYNVIGDGIENNGITATTVKLDNYKLYDARKTIALANRGNFFASVQITGFYIGTRVKALTEKFLSNKYILLYIATIINKEKFKYSYGRNACDKIGDIEILLPIKENNELDITYMEKYIKTIYNGNLIKTNNISNVMDLKNTTWKQFKITDSFKIVRTKPTTIEELEEYGLGDYPYITTQSTNNGVAGKYNFFTEEGNVLTIDSAVVGYCTYQEKSFSASDHIEKLIPKFKLNKYIALFLATIINFQNYKYSYGRKFNQNQIKNTELFLPSKNESRILIIWKDI
ncbi:MAG: hypothetical protein HFI87_00145 [Bacilli bacterium]|nr:hypothetical protein [Bacilli bacterium]